MSAILSPELESYVDGLVTSGRFPSRARAIEASVELMRQRESDRQTLLAKLREGQDALSAGDFDELDVDGSDRMFDELLAGLPNDAES